MRVLRLITTLACAAIATMCLTSAESASAKTVWLCRPGQLPDPCTPALSTTVYSPTLAQRGVQHLKQMKNPPIDCFYVYPTVSDQKTINANLQIDPRRYWE